MPPFLGAAGTPKQEKSVTHLIRKRQHERYAHERFIETGPWSRPGSLPDAPGDRATRGIRSPYLPIFPRNFEALATSIL